ncbi:MAG: 5'-nucleotidase C-terminal domain-containing protein [Prolixibacteraceae bacterium]|nr:5'-nucleotidase C-terminal domain-containing protein [Prolixibacteraceae bacterium]
MNKLLLIPLLGLLVSCVTVYETNSYTAVNHSIDHLTDSITDTGFSRIIEPYRERLGDELSEIISFSDSTLVNYRPESPLSNFLSDLMLDYGESFSEKNGLNKTPCFSLMNHGGIRSFIPQGEVNVENMYQLIPFENELVFLRLSGVQVIELANHIASRGGEGVSGISFGINSEKAANINIKGKKLDAEGTYWLVTNDYLANGGDGMKVLTESLDRYDSGIKLRNLYIEELKKMKQQGMHINAKSDGRLFYVE